MSSYFPFPDISPDIFSISVFGVTIAPKWYAMAYIAGILIGWWIAAMAIKRAHLWDTAGPAMIKEQLEELLTSIILGVVIGGRLGYVLFYQPAYYLENPLEIPMIWQGGMAFHGGLAGVIVAVLLFWRKHGVSLWKTADLLAISTAPGLLLGRIANFINGELWGRPTLSPWGVAFPGSGQDCAADLLHPDGVCARFPSQLYEAGLEGILLGAILLWLAFGRGLFKRPGALTGVFFAGYGVARMIVEYFRQADAQFITPDNPLGLVLQIGGSGLSMGQLLSLPMVAFGALLLARALRKPVAV